MTSPYRTLPVAPTATRAVCLYCKHVAISQYDYPKCRARARAVRDPVRGEVVKDDYRDCALVRFDDAGDERDCADFVPTLATRVLRALGGRR